MTLFQLIMLVAAGVIFYIFFKQILSDDYPKRGVDFEAEVPSGFRGNNDAKEMEMPLPGKRMQSRLEELASMADSAVEREDYIEAKKALQSALVLQENNIGILRRLGVVCMRMNDFVDAKETFEELLAIDEEDDLAHASLANALHRLGEDEKAFEHHKRSIELDAEYAPHYYNYANTLYDLGKKEEALELYEKAFRLDPEMKEAEQMIKELSK